MTTLSQLGVNKCVYMLLVYSMDISFEEDERTLTMIDPLYGGSFVSSQSNEDEHVVDENGPQQSSRWLKAPSQQRKTKMKS